MVLSPRDCFAGVPIRKGLSRMQKLNYWKFFT
jgi:hypothetical protein